MKLFKFAFAVTLILCSSCGFADEVIVKTATDLATALTTSQAGTTVTLGADIDCTGWTTVDGFSGTLDGKGYKIENLDAPLFGTITGDIAISNLVVKDASVTVTAETSGMLMKSVTTASLAVENVTFTGSTLRNTCNRGNVAFVVGLFSVTSAATFTNCHVDDTCSLALGVNQHAGIAGNGTATGTGATISFTHCTMAAALSTAMSSGSQFGGIAGNLSVQGGGRYVEDYAHLVMDGCTNYSGTGSSIWAGSNRSFGGIVHTAASGNSTHMGDVVIRSCANYGSFVYNGSLTSSGTNYGGLVGRWTSGKLTMEDCVNYGSVASTGSGDTRSEIGGLIGAIVAPIQVEVSITGCANTGDITGWYAGGLVGTLSHNKDYVNTKILIRSCMNTGAIAARKEGVSPGEAIGALISGVAYSRIDIKGGFYATDALVGTYGEGASVTALNTDGNVFSDNSDGLVDGADLAALNAYNSGCNLWKQGHEFPILKIMPDEAAPDTIVATFEDWDETILKQKTVARGGYVFPPADPVRDGYTFIGWAPDEFSGLTADTTFTAQYSSGILTHTVTFYDWDGSQIGEAQTIVHGEAATAPADPVREDYLFAGWSVPFDNVTEDLQVFAQYVASHTYVSTAEGFAAAVTADVLPGVTIHLSADIVLPADWAAPDFRAVFDGGGHTISCENGGLPLFGHLSGTASNFVINAESDGAPLEITIANNVSFGAVARIVNGGTVADVSVLNLTVKLGGGSKAGLLVGELGDGGMILGCTAEGTCTLRHKQGAAGGIVGGVFRSSDFAPVDGEGNPVLGLSVAVIADCTNNAPLVQTGTSGFQAGGILGSADVHNPTYQPDIRILRCANHGDLRAVAGYAASGSVGGILGQRSVNASGHGGVLRIVDCSNTGYIVSPCASGANLGGIVGYFWRGCEAELDRCVNRGAVGTEFMANGTTAVTGNSAGGIFGNIGELYRENPVTATNCANYGAVTGGKYAGGFIGGFNANQGHPSTILMFYNCANYGALSAPAEGGLTGEIFARFETEVADSPSRQYGAVNSFFMTNNFCADTSGSAIITNGLVTAADVGYTPSAAKKTLNIVANESGYEPWVLGRIGEGNAAFVAPELACFMTKKANPGFTIIIK